MSDKYFGVLKTKKYYPKITSFGKTGLNAYQLAVANGFEGTIEEWLESLTGAQGAVGPVGPQGIAGSSAYEIAVANGFEGTEEEWINFLNGSVWKDDIASAITTKGVTTSGGDTKEQFINNINAVALKGKQWGPVIIEDITEDGFIKEISVLQLFGYLFTNYSEIEDTIGMWSKLQKVNLADTITILERSSFYACVDLQQINLENITELSQACCMRCESLDNIDLSNIETFENYVFYGCINLREVSIPKISELGSYNFYNCDSLQQAVLGSVGYPISLVGTNCFYSCEVLELITIYTIDGNVLSGSPWGATGADIVFLDAFPNLIQNADFSDGINFWYSAEGYSLSVNNGELMMEVNEINGGARIYQWVTTIIEGHIYYAKMQLKPKYDSTLRMRLGGLIDIDTINVSAGIWNTFSGIVTAPLGSSNLIVFYHPTNYFGYQLGDLVYAKKVKLLDLTEIYGASNEPTKEYMDAFFA